MSAVEVKNVLKINAGAACKDRTDEVEPRPNEVEKSTFAIKKSRRDDMSVENSTENSAFGRGSTPNAGMCRKISKIKVLTLLFLLFSFVDAQATIRYVKTTANGGAAPNGSTSTTALNATTWATATSDLQAVINVSVAGDQIWVAEGTYTPIYTASGYNATTPTYPNTNGSRDNRFVLKAGVKIYGGFTGSETSVADRDTVMTDGIIQMKYKSILSGNNICYQVVIGAGSMTDGTDTARLDGFTITGGNGDVSGYNTIIVNGQYIMRNYGGGIHNVSNSSPVITNCIVSGNTVYYLGGGIYNDNSSPALTNVIISGNTTTNSLVGNGGGIYNTYSSPVMTNVTVSGNKANASGGGIYNTYSAPVLTNVTVSGNTANGSGGGGGIFNTNSAPVLTNCIISGNTASACGGGIYNDNSSPSLTNVIISGNRANRNNNVGAGMYNSNSSTTLTNVTISGNKAPNSVSLNIGVGGILNDGGSLVIKNSVIWGNRTNGVQDNLSGGASIENSLIEGSCSGGNWNYGTNLGNNINATASPFVNWIDPMSYGWVATTAGDYRLCDGSPAINAGSDSIYLTARGIANFTNEKDLDGGARLLRDTIDMGAYEYTGSVMPLKEDLNPGTISPAQSICYNTNPTILSGTAVTGGNSPYIYQWQQSADGVSNWTNATGGSGATSESYTPPKLTATTYYQRAVTDGNCKTVYSNVIKITVYENLNSGTLIANKAICYGTSPGELSQTPPSGGTDISYQWQHSDNGTNWADINSETNINYMPAALTATKYYRRIVTSSGSCGSNTTAVLTVTVYDTLIAGSLHDKQVHCSSGIAPAIFLGSNSATGGKGKGVYTYRWEDSTAQTPWTYIGVSDQTHDLNGVLLQTTYYRRAVIDYCGTAYSDMITVYPAPKVSATLDTICPGLSAHIFPNSEGRWESSDSSIVDIINSGTIVGMKPGKAKLTFYDSIVGGCSSALEITVKAYPEPEEITGKEVVCVSSSVQLYNSSPGFWEKNNNNISFDDPTVNPVTVRGVKEGKTFVKYTVSNGACQTTRIFRIKVIPAPDPNNPPKIIIGVER